MWCLESEVACLFLFIQNGVFSLQAEQFCSLGAVLMTYHFFVVMSVMSVTTKLRIAYRATLLKMAVVCQQEVSLAYL